MYRWEYSSRKCLRQRLPKHPQRGSACSYGRPVLPPQKPIPVQSPQNLGLGNCQVRDVPVVGTSRIREAITHPWTEGRQTLRAWQCRSFPPANAANTLEICGANFTCFCRRRCWQTLSAQKTSKRTLKYIRTTRHPFHPRSRACALTPATTKSRPLHDLRFLNLPCTSAILCLSASP